MTAGLARTGWLVCVALATAAAATGENVTLEYDALGRLRSVAAESGVTRTYIYDGAGNRILSQLSGGASAVGDGLPPGGADVDGDGVLAPADLAALYAAYGTSIGEGCFVGAADLDGSGHVDLADVRLWHFYDPESEWLAGDWTGSVGRGSQDWEHAPPDGRVDFLDLAALAHGWRRPAPLGSRNSWLDIGPVGGDGFVDEGDLAAFSANWLVDEALSIVPDRSVCGAAGSEAVVATSSGRLEVRCRDLGAAGLGDVVLEIVLVDAARLLEGFQCVVTPDLATLGFRGSPDPDGAGGLIRIGSAAQASAGSCFLDLRPVEGGTLLTGAFLDREPPASASEMVVCTMVVPRSAVAAVVAVTDVRLATSVGEVLSLADWSGELSLDPLPAVPFVCRVHPNPFNPVTTIRWAIPADADVDLRIFDVRGRQVCVLVDRRMPRGWHEARWLGCDSEGHDLASGVYLFRLRSGGDTLTGKMNLVR